MATVVQPKPTTTAVPAITTTSRPTKPAVVASRMQRISENARQHRRLMLFRKLYERRSFILAAIEGYLLRNSDSSSEDSDEMTNLLDPERAKIYRSFLAILRNQQRLRMELATAGTAAAPAAASNAAANGSASAGFGGGFTAAIRRRWETKYESWEEKKLNRLLSLLTDLYRHVQSMIVDVGRLEPWNNDMFVLAAVTGNNATQGNFNLLSDIYSVVFRLV